MSITPFQPDGRIDEQLLRNHLSFLADGGVGVYLCSQGSGEGDLMTIDERIEVYRIGVDQIGGRTPVYAAGVGLAHSTERIVALAKGACAAGVDAVYVLGPRPGALAPRPHEIEAYFSELIEAIDRPVVLSNNSSLAGYSFSTALIEKLVGEYAHIKEVLLADAPGPLINQVAELRRSLGDRVVIRVGMSNMTPVAHAAGAQGMLNFEGNMVPRLSERMWTALLNGDATKSAALFKRFLALNLLCARYGNPRVIKEALRVVGRDGGSLRKPYLPMLDHERTEFADAFRALQLGDFETW